MLLEPSKFPLLRLDADFQRVTLGNQALKSARRIEQKALDLTLGAMLADSRLANSRRLADHADRVPRIATVSPLTSGDAPRRRLSAVRRVRPKFTTARAPARRLG
jgi:hypothetical protein